MNFFAEDLNDYFMFSNQRGKILIRLILRNQLKSKRHPDYDECFDKLMYILERRERRFHFAKREFSLPELVSLCNDNGFDIWETAGNKILCKRGENEFEVIQTDNKDDGFIIYPNCALYLCGCYCINGGAKRAIKFMKLFLEMEELLRNIEESDKKNCQ